MAARRGPYNPFINSGMADYAKKRQEQISRVSSRVNPMHQGIDIREIMKPEINAYFEADTPQGIADSHITLDSWRKDPSSSVPARGLFVFNVEQQFSKNLDQVIAVKTKVENLTEARIIPFTMPIIPDTPYVLSAGAPVSNTSMQIYYVCNNDTTTGAPTLVPNLAADPAANLYDVGQYPTEIITDDAIATGAVVSPWINNPFTQLPFGNELAICVREWQAQSIVGSAGLYHYDMIVARRKDNDINPNVLYVMPKDGSGDFVFTDPIREPFVGGQLSLQFYNPDIPVVFDEDVLLTKTYVNGAVGVPTYMLCFYCPGHNLCAGDRVYIKDFNSAYPLLNIAVNRDIGYGVNGYPGVPGPVGSPQVGPGLVIGGDYIYLDPCISLQGFSGLGADFTAIAGKTIKIYVAKRRLYIRMRLRCLIDRVTQGIPTQNIHGVRDL